MSVSRPAAPAARANLLALQRYIKPEPGLENVAPRVKQEPGIKAEPGVRIKPEPRGDAPPVKPEPRRGGGPGPIRATQLSLEANGYRAEARPPPLAPKASRKVEPYGQKPPKKKPSAPRPPRPPSAYNIYVRDILPKIKAANPTFTHQEAFRVAAANWTKSPLNPANAHLAAAPAAADDWAPEPEAQDGIGAAEMETVDLTSDGPSMEEAGYVKEELSAVSEIVKDEPVVKDEPAVKDEVAAEGETASEPDRKPEVEAEGGAESE
ncbi:hypothetical protein DFJ74DRAFT_732513 [Hyaloraphidium curvatum]|nr:hypothetical protein DFJ74DRAFT_732513 [Hyaloraphidium curvatum]